MDLVINKIMTDRKADSLQKEFLDASYIKTLITEDTDIYDGAGGLLAKFRKRVLPIETLKLGVDSFKDSIEWTESRGSASGRSGKRVKKDGSLSNTTVGNFVENGSVGYMDPSALVRYCRKTAFARDHFDKFTAGVPFIQAIDGLYKDLCPKHHAKQLNMAQATNINYRIADTAFSTVTVNKNFRTAVHKDSGDYQEGFGNLIAYREGDWTGGYFILPQYGIGFDLQNTDVLFVDVHQWHCNTPFIGMKETDLRISFVLYYREYLYKCKGPAEELARVKQDQLGYLRL